MKIRPLHDRVIVRREEEEQNNCRWDIIARFCAGKAQSGRSSRCG